jgi:hypothetical protein
VTEDIKQNPQASSDGSELLLEVHLHEYEALTNRATYYIAMSTAIWPLIFIYLGLLGTAWQHLSPADSAKFGFPLIAWGGSLGIQIALAFWTFLVCEQYKTVLYLERDLRPLVQPLLSTPDFWLYERRKRQPRWFELLTEFWIVVLILTVVVLRAFVFPGFTALDWIGLALNVFVLSVLIWMAVAAAQIRHGWEA